MSITVSNRSILKTGKIENKKKLKVAWLTPVIGVNGKLLYWERLYKEYSRLFKQLKIFTLEFDGKWTISNVDMEVCGKYKRLYKNERLEKTNQENYISGISVASPFVISRLTEYLPELIVVSEFGILTFFGLFYARFIKNTPVLLLVEAEPRFQDGFILRVVRTCSRKLVLHCIDAVITNNNQGFNYLTLQMRADSDKVVVSPYLLSIFNDGKEYFPKKVMGKRIKFLYVGNVSIRKGLVYLFNAFSMLLPNYKQNYICDIVGSGVDETELKRMVSDMGLAENIVFHGRKEYEDLSELYEKANVFVFPSLGDYRALVTFEALSVGLPIIGSIYDGGVSEVVMDNENGFLVNPREIKDFSMKLLMFIENPDLIEKFSIKSLQIANTYNYEQAKKGLLYACNLAISNRKNGAKPSLY